MVADKYICATKNALYVSIDGATWLKDVSEFKDSTINGIYESDDVLYV